MPCPSHKCIHAIHALSPWNCAVEFALTPFLPFQGLTHGVAFQLLGEKAFEYLNNREVTLGGYDTHMTTFESEDGSRAPFPVLFYNATSSNDLWLGSADEEEIAEEVVHSEGNTGHNVEYVLKGGIHQSLLRLDA
jgi:cation transport regulator ChaC